MLKLEKLFRQSLRHVDVFSFHSDPFLAFFNGVFKRCIHYVSNWIEIVFD